MITLRIVHKGELRPERLAKFVAWTAAASVLFTLTFFIFTWFPLFFLAPAASLVTTASSFLLFIRPNPMGADCGARTMAILGLFVGAVELLADLLVYLIILPAPW